MKSIFTKVEFHYSFLIMAFGLVITGHFSNLLVFSSLILAHEFGHVLVAKIFKYKVEKVIIYPYGGLTKLDSLINTNINKDIMVAISGIVMQCLYFITVYLLYSNGIIREYIYNLFILYHNSMIFFNLLPIIPLDGFKILNLFLSKFLNFNLSNNVSVFISLFTIIIFILCDFYEKNYSMILVIAILMQNIYKFYYQISFIYNRFLIERYLYGMRYNNCKVIRDIKKMYKNKNHIFMKNGRFVPEKEILIDFFRKKQ